MNKNPLSISNRKKGQTLLKIRKLFAYGEQIFANYIAFRRGHLLLLTKTRGTVYNKQEKKYKTKGGYSNEKSYGDFSGYRIACCAYQRMRQ